jgi:hypothetical protein
MATLPEIPEIDAIFVFFKWKGPTLISNMDSTLNSGSIKLQRRSSLNLLGEVGTDFQISK